MPFFPDGGGDQYPTGIGNPQGMGQMGNSNLYQTSDWGHVQQLPRIGSSGNTISPLMQNQTHNNMGQMSGMQMNTQYAVPIQGNMGMPQMSSPMGTGGYQHSHSSSFMVPQQQPFLVAPPQLDTYGHQPQQQQQAPQSYQQQSYPQHGYQQSPHFQQLNSHAQNPTHQQSQQPQLQQEQEPLKSVAKNGAPTKPLANQPKKAKTHYVPPLTTKKYKEPPRTANKDSGEVPRIAAVSIEELHRELTRKSKTATDKLLTKLGPIEFPKTPQDKEMLPSARLHHFLASVCGPSLNTSSEVDKAMTVLAEEYIHGAIAFAVSMARRRGTGSHELYPSDIDLYMRHLWGINVPGLSHGKICTYRRLAGVDAHRIRMKAVRRGNGAAFLKAIPSDRRRETATERRKRLELGQQQEGQVQLQDTGMTSGREEGEEEIEDEMDGVEADDVKEEVDIGDKGDDLETEQEPAADVDNAEGDVDEEKDNVDEVDEQEEEEDEEEEDDEDDEDMPDL